MAFCFMFNNKRIKLSDPPRCAEESDLLRFVHSFHDKHCSAKARGDVRLVGNTYAVVRVNGADVQILFALAQGPD